VASVSDIGVDECFELIRRAPLLRPLGCRIYPPPAVFPIPNTRIIRPHLHSLELSRIARKMWSLESLIRCVCPLGAMDSRPTPFAPGQHDIIHRMFIFLSENIQDQLCLLSSLEFLELRSPTYRPSDELLPVLWASAQSPLFLPRLQSLEFACEFYSPWKYLHHIFTLSHRQSLRVKIDSKLTGSCARLKTKA
jgi:hypothetical protein